MITRLFNTSSNKLGRLMRSLFVIILGLTLSVKLYAQQSALVDNTYTPLVSATPANFTNTTSETCLIGCTDHFSPLGNLTNTNTSDAATWSSLAAVGTVDRWVQVQDNRATSDLYKAGTYAGFVFTSSTLLSALSTTTVTVQTYLNGNPVGASSGAISISGLVKLAASNQAKVGYISTADYNAIRITFHIAGVASLTPSISVHYAEVANFVEGPQLACNTKTSMNLNTYPMSISSTVNSGSFSIQLLGGISNIDAAISSSTSDFATIDPSVGALGDNVVVAIKDNATDYPYPTFVGFDIESSSLLSLAVGGNFSLTGYKDGAPVSTATGNSLLVGAQLLNGSNRQTIGFVPSGDIDEVRLTLNSGAIAGVTLASTKIYGAIFRRFCEVTPLACNTLSILDESNYPVYINAPRTGVTGGVLGTNNKLEDGAKVIDNDPNTYATATVLVGVDNQVSLSVRKELLDFSTGTFAGFEIGSSSTLLNADLLGDITIKLYKDGNPMAVQTATGSTQLAAISSSLLGGGSSRMVVGVVAIADYDEAVISFNNTVSASTGITKIYSFYSQNFCTGSINCNGTYWLNSGAPPTGYPVIINGQRTGTTGLACVNVSGVELSNPGNVITSSTTDYATIKLGANVLCPVSISVEDVLTIYPSGTIAGFAIRNIGSLVEADLFNSITIETWLTGAPRESNTIGNLLNLQLLNSPIIGVGTGTYNVGFQTTMTFDEVRISVNSLLNVDPLAEVRVYGAFVDTRNVTSGGSQELTCLVPSIAPANPAPICQGNNVLLTATPAGATTYTWYKDNVVIGGATSQTYSATATGSYTVTVNASGYSGVPSNAVTVTVNPIPSTPTIDPAGSIGVCGGSTVLLTSSAVTGNQWYKDNEIIGGATNQTYTATTSGSYTVIVTESGCNSPASDPTVVTVTNADAPLLSGNTASNVCPAGTASLDGITASNTPANSVLTWHTGTPATTANKVANSAAVPAGTYYAAFYIALYDCYSGSGNATTAVTVTINSCAGPLNAGSPPVTYASPSEVISKNASTDLAPTGGITPYSYSIGSADGACVAPTGASPLPGSSNLTITDSASGAHTYTAPAAVGTYYYCIKVCDSTNPIPQCVVRTYTVIVSAECAAEAQVLQKQ